MKLLIAEDDLTSRSILSGVTAKWGYQPVLTEDGEAAWEVLQGEEAPRLLLLDWEMPKLDGTALCKRIRQQKNENPPYIILLTTRNDSSDIVSGLEAGANDYIVKPFENTELQARLNVGRRMLNLQTERIEAEEQKIVLQKQLQQAQKMEAIGQLTGGIAHDFNNLLASIMGYTELLKDKVNDLGDDKMRHYLEQVYASSERARDLVAKMLMYSRGPVGEFEPLALTPLIKESLKMFGPDLPSSIEIDLQLESDDIAIMTQPAQLQQLLMNLCLNACEAMQGKGRITIGLQRVNSVIAECSSCHEKIDGDYIQFSVTDTGPGIKPEQLGRIFDPFYTTKPLGSDKGTGMGLAMVHGIMHDHGGHIVVDTEKGEGTKFSLMFPVLRKLVGE